MQEKWKHVIKTEVRKKMKARKAWKKMKAPQIT